MRILSFSRVSLIVSLIFCLTLGGIVTAQDERPSLPDSVTIAGTVQSVLGCPGDWQPECESTQLTYDAANDIWRGSFDLSAGSYEYKAAINGTWDLSYGLNANSTAGSVNIPLEVEADTTVTFYFDHVTGWVTDDVHSLIITAPGSYQDEAGCPGEWQPDCLRSWLQDADGDGVYSYTSPGLPAGDYELKVAVGLSWDENYGVGGAAGGDNIPITVTEDGLGIVVTFDPATTTIDVSVTSEPVAMAPTAPQQPAGGGGGGIAQPDMVNIPGTIQPSIGCPGEWQPDCTESQLTLDEEGQVWIGTYSLPAGTYEYKVAINGAWTENYGAFADQGGANISLNVPEDGDVTFIYSHETHWISDSVRHRIVTAAGSYQDEIGCAAEWDPACMRSWLQDVDGDGIYTLTVSSMPAGDYEVKVAINRNWDENYGANGEAGGSNIAFTVPDTTTAVTFAFDSTANLMVVSVGGGGVSSSSIRDAVAHWVTRDTFAWNVDINPDSTYQLLSSADASFRIGLTGVDPASQYVAYDLTPVAGGLSDDVLARFPHLAGYNAFQLSADAVDAVPDILRGQALIAEYSSGGTLIILSGLQIPGVLDDLYTYDGALGITFSDGVPTFSVWAPTAQTVRFMLFADSGRSTDPTYLDMERDNTTGVWSVTGEADWVYQYYLFEVTVYAPTTLAIEVNEVTDPYSVSLSNNSQRSQIVDLNDPALMPDGWQDFERLAVAEPEDIVLYELHVRDFSIFDETVPEGWRGTYMAFTVSDSSGMTHLGNLADAGLTHVHLLPVFDIATINENRPRHFFPDYEAMAATEANSDFQQAQIDPIRDLDGFNWGYDPFHFNVPEGSYATDSDGPQRILEFRSMVMALNHRGLSAVMDVVYNHTNASGQDRRSVFDRIVPGYYHRLTETGRVATSTCCQNTATEHNMMRRFMVDSVVLWTTAYHIDGFRFDLMGHHMVDDMLAVRTAVDGLTRDANGVDGRYIYIYGEGWNFGEVADNARGINATQLNIGGTGIGAFNDRLRDAVRGGNPFGDYQYQGFVTGLFYEPNGITPGDETEQRDRILLFGDQIRVGMAGNLRDYSFINRTGDSVTGAEVDYNGSPAGYTLDPQENIVYVSAHDNETFWDIVQYKVAPGVSVADRVRMQNVAISIVGFSQGVPFYHAGMDMLRSKSFDRNSYNSGDWFNRLDFTYQTNNFGIGLPPQGDNSAQWDIQRPLLANEALYVTQNDILSSVNHMQEVLRIRQSSVLFRLRTADDVQVRVGFHNTGTDQIPGVIVMSLDDMSEGLADIDPDYASIVVVVNARNDDLTFTDAAFASMALELHPVQMTSADVVVQMSAFDAATGTFTVPARTVAVFVLPQG